ncbi:hypothetical protein DITRI_Ditri08aG0153700 [Diplodiscus trichospermus]
MELPFFPTLFSTVKDFTVKQPFFPTLEDWLVKHPKIHEFSWNYGQTLGSSRRFLTLTVLSYISLTFILSQVSRPSLARPVLKLITAVHSIFLLALSFVMAVGCLVSIFSQVPNFSTLVCFPKRTPPSGPLFFWGYFFYLSKIVEFIF